MKRFVEWDQLEVRVNGDKLNTLAQSFRTHPIEKLELRFENGRLLVIGAVRKFVSIPFEVEIREIEASRRTVRVPLKSVAVFGGFPIPRFLVGLLKDRLPAEFVRYEEPATLVLSLEHLLPDLIDAEIQHVWIIDGGLAVTLGRGGADLPAVTEESDGGDPTLTPTPDQRR